MSSYTHTYIYTKALSSKGNARVIQKQNRMLSSIKIYASAPHSPLVPRLHLTLLLRQKLIQAIRTRLWLPDSRRRSHRQYWLLNDLLNLHTLLRSRGGTWLKAFTLGEKNARCWRANGWAEDLVSARGPRRFRRRWRLLVLVSDGRRWSLRL